MTRCDGNTITSTESSAPCDCEGCRTGDLPVNPFLALRVAYGMLLGEDDFRTLMGNPRGKQMLHSAWLHGRGVVWGYAVQPDGLRNLRIGDGLAIDGAGRELLNEATDCVDVRDLVNTSSSAGSGKGGRQQDRTDDASCASWTITACLLAEYDSCLTAAVPTLADPCDVTRKHDDYSRVVERVRFRLVEGSCPRPARAYHRVRVLLGLEPVGSADPAGQQAAACRAEVAAAPAPRRPAVLLDHFRRLAALDSLDLTPARQPGECYPGLFPAADDDSAVVLASVEIDVRERDGCPEILEIRADPSLRSTLLPTWTIQELSCASAPGLLGNDDAEDAGGPRVIGADITLSSNGRRLLIPVTQPLARGSVPGSVGITTLSPDKVGGWVVEDLYDTRFDTDHNTIVVELADRPVNNLIRIVVKGTGAKPVVGKASGIPLAGLVGGPPGTVHDGHDAVWTFANPVAGRDYPTPGEDSSDYEDTGAESVEDGSAETYDGTGS
jgi:hypothetical protein